MTAAYPNFPDTATTHRIETEGGVVMRVVEDGAGPPLLLIPGGDSPAEAYVQLVAHLRDAYRCISYDPRGVGDTVAPPGPWTIEAMAANAAAILERLCDGPAAVSGLSMGGLLTQAVAIDFPELVRVAIPMGTAAHIDWFTRDWMQAEIDLRRAGIALPPDFMAPHYAVFAYPAKALHYPAIWAEVKAAYASRFVDRAPQDTIDQWQACLDYDCRARLPDCPVPFHVVAFSEDVQTAPSMCRVVSDLARDGTFHEMPGLGHVSLNRHRPDLVADKLRDILARVP